MVTRVSSKELANLLITGGGGFIGSHTTLCLLEAGHSVVVLDSFVNSHQEALRRVAHLAGLPPLAPTESGEWQARGESAALTVLQGDVRNPEDVERALTLQHVEAVLHFAGLKTPAESIRKPLLYWAVNVRGSCCLLEGMRGHGCRTLIFSSSAALYGLPDTVPVSESAPIQPLHPYGHSKAAVEQLLEDLAASEQGWRIGRLRYFNPVGAHPSGRLGEDPQGVPENLMPYLAQVATGEQERLRIFGDDYPTPDGTGVRDYIHVVDLARAHVAALDHAAGTSGVDVFNIGTGRGYSVKEMLAAFSAEVGRDLPCEVVGRRPGDVAEMRADCSKAGRVLGWRAEFGLDRMVRDLWRWQKNHPRGYRA